MDESKVEIDLCLSCLYCLICLDYDGVENMKPCKNYYGPYNKEE